MKYISNLLLAKKIAFGYIIIMVVATLSGLIVFYNLQRLKSLDNQLTELNTKLIIKLKDYSSLVNESVKLSNAWIYQPEKDAKDRLVEVIENDLPANKEELLASFAEVNADSTQTQIDEFFNEATLLTASEKEITKTLVNDESYSDDAAVDKAINLYDKDLTANFSNFKMKYVALLNKLNERQDAMLEIKKDSHSFMNISMIVVMITVVIIGLFSTGLSNKLISKPINHLQNIIDLSSKGELIEVKIQERKDEIGKINNSISVLVQNLKDKTNFATAIGKGDYEKELSIYSEADVLGKALINMRNSLKLAQIEDKKRDWFNTGLANISEVLRKYQSEPDKMYDEVMRFVVKYLDGNQGSFFEISNFNGEDALELKACYAYDRKKYAEKKFGIGEGLVGQCVIEKEPIFLTDVPQDYTYITSGVGDATPSCVLIFPLIVNEKVYGAIELASFKVFEKHEVDFAMKIGESIASTVSTVKVNSVTKKLLEQAKIKEEELRAQEEEMRQNMEELHATQEQSRRQEIVMQEQHTKEIAELRAFYERKFAVVA